jgi:hypothetical protein
MTKRFSKNKRERDISLFTYTLYYYPEAIIIIPPILDPRPKENNPLGISMRIGERGAGTARSKKSE